MAQRITIYVPDYCPPSLNRRQGRHWSRSRKDKQRALDHLWARFHEQHGGVPQFAGPVRLRIIRIIGHRCRPWDEDNLAAAMKPVIDALRRRTAHHHGGLGVFEDDSPAMLTLEIEQRKPLVTSTVVALEELGLDRDRQRAYHEEASRRDSLVISIEGTPCSAE